MATRRGDAAKENATKAICEAFGDNVVCIQDKKIYVNVRDGEGVGCELVQLAISMTMPKTPIAATEVNDTGPASSEATTPHPAAELSASDREKIEELKKMLGVS